PDTTFTALILQLEPGAGTSTRHSLISHIQVCFVLKGTVQLEINDTPHRLTEMEGIYFNTAIDHQWLNAGDTPAEVLIYNPYDFTLFEQKEENLRWNLHLKKEKKREKLQASSDRSQN
ncbi:MAG TPA: cupin domain-containing protein, partial [Candidatus Methylacidiphilales bacterium]